jgi:hypothetical protein
MRIRTKIALGTSFAAGYYFGAKAGRERYVQLRRVLDARPLGKGVEKVQALVELTVERVRHASGRTEPVQLRAATWDEATGGTQLSSR